MKALEGASRGLLRDCTTSPMDSFTALDRIGTEVELTREMRICEDLKRAQGGRGLGVGVKLSF